MHSSFIKAQCFLYSIFVTIGFSDMVNITASRDNTIFAHNGGLSNGQGFHIFTGRTTGNSGTGVRRALVFFDVAGNIPAGSTINSASLRLILSRGKGGVRVCSFHRLLADWGESTSAAGGMEGQGGVAAMGDATWSHRFYTNTLWGTMGGDLNPAISASVAVNLLGTYNWTNAPMAADVQDMLDNAGNNFGWILIGVEGVASTAKRFHSVQAVAPANRPLLTVDFTPPPPAFFTVTNTLPAHAAIDVAANSDITVQFNSMLDSNTVDGSSFKVWGSQSGFRAGTYSFSSAVFNPGSDFQAGEEVYVMLNTNIETDVGLPLTPYQFQFVVEAGGCTSFLPRSIQGLGNRNSFDIGLGDLDGDGNLDAYVGNNAQGNTVWTNDGTGLFYDTGQSLGSGQSLKVALGDLDDDGDLDVFVANNNGPNTVWTNDGTGAFSTNGQLLGTNLSYGVKGFCFKDPGQGIQLVQPAYRPEALANGIGGGRFNLDSYFNRIM